MKKTSVYLFFLLIFLIAIQGFAQTNVRIMSINTEWFWDHEHPHEGSIAIGPRGNSPTEKEAMLEAYAIAQIIIANDANIVGLVEVENENVVDLVKSYLPGNDWEIAFEKGRDNITGQDVALLTRFEIINNSVTNYGDIAGVNRPSKVLGIGLNVGSSSVYVVVTHLISQRGNNDAKRLDQANFIRQRIINESGNYDHLVILGDLNDFPDSPPLRRLRGLDDPESDFIQTAITTGSDPAFSYIYNNQKNLLDHILLSSSLQSTFGSLSAEQRHWTIDTGPISDHKAVMVRFELN